MHELFKLKKEQSLQLLPLKKMINITFFTTFLANITRSSTFYPYLCAQFLIIHFFILFCYEENFSTLKQEKKK